MVTQQNVIDAVKALILADTTISTAIQNRIFEIEPPTKGKFPYLTIFPVIDDIFHRLDSRNVAKDFSMTLQIDIYDKWETKNGKITIRELNEAIFAVLNDCDITITNAAHAECIAEARGTQQVLGSHGGSVVTCTSEYRIFGTMLI